MTPKEKALELSEKFTSVDEMLNFIMIQIQDSNDPEYWELVYKEFY